ncbi:hypothetical protein BGX31_005020 [Mortierella sp. GBA43]|nr:hypothetical protein BGX31_005020 [Mortierella sp. GBA43]
MNKESQDIVKQPGKITVTPPRTHGWNQLWEKGIHPWDKPAPSPALVEVIEQKPIKDQIPTTGNVLVPGCGRGVDVFYLRNKDRKVYGLDISPIAVEQCQELQKAQNIPDSEVHFFVDDFFKFDIPQGGFQLIYDYTFFCAIPPELRPSWGQRMAELITKDGVLITLMYPLKDHEGGPPFAVSEAAYHAELDANFECLLVDNCTSHEARVGFEKIGIWKRRA